MYSVKPHVLQLVALMLEHGIHHVVLCPGSRNIPIVQTIASRPEFTCYRVTDERSAGFFALGLALEKQEAVAVCCTSGSALLNIHPAVSEAFYQQVPLLVISGDRAEAWIGQMDGQTLPQAHVFGSLVRSSVNLPEIHDATEEWYCNRLINEALLSLDHHVKGPVHINVPLSEPLFDFSCETLPQARLIKRYSRDQKPDFMRNECIHMGMQQLLEDCNEFSKALLQHYPRIMVLLGQNTQDLLKPFLDLDKETQDQLAKSVLFVSEHLSNCAHAPYLCSSLDLMLMTKEWQDSDAPDLVITMGGHLVSKRTKQYLRAHKPRRHWHVCADGALVDLFCCLGAIIEEEPQIFLQKFCQSLLSHSPSEASITWTNRLHTLENALPKPNFGYSQMYAIGEIIKTLPQGSALHLANSSTVRYAQLFTLPENIRVNCNRGVNGIEGSLSAALGFAAASTHLNYIMIGDLSFFYDMNALWQPQLRNNVRLFLFNNQSGEIFHALPGLEFTAKTRAIITAEHTMTGEKWAESCGFTYLALHSVQELQDCLPRLAEPSETPIFVEIFTSNEEDVHELQAYYQKIKQVTF